MQRGSTHIYAKKSGTRHIDVIETCLEKVGDDESL